MKINGLSLFVVCGLILGLTSLSTAQNTLKKKESEKRNKWGISFVYAESGFGVSGSFFAPVSKSTDLFFNLLVSGVTDSRELERYDIFGNTIIPSKINRVFMAPLSIGLRKELFKNDLEGNFTPVINFGIAPTLVLISPYDKGFFKSLGYVNAKFAFGAFGGIGVNFRQSENITLNVNLNYYYLPVLGGGVKSLQHSTIRDLGGFQLAFGLNFMH